jgi:hypothetical protein
VAGIGLSLDRERKWYTMSKRRMKWLMDSFPHTDEKSMFRKTKKWWKSLSIPEKQELVKERQ